jgi:hypothetical protein
MSTITIKEGMIILGRQEQPTKITNLPFITIKGVNILPGDRFKVLAGGRNEEALLRDTYVKSFAKGEAEPVCVLKMSGIELLELPVADVSAAFRGKV